MNYRTAVLHAEENLAISGTKTIPVTIRDPISALIFPFRLTVATGARLLPEADAMSKIELVDGSTTLLSLSGSEMAALSFYEGARQINVSCENLTTQTQRGHLRINFGRFLRDPLLALDPTRFSNLQLRVTYDVTRVQALATNLYLAVIAECFDEKVITPVGFLRHTEHRSYTPSTGETEPTNLPKDLVLRKLYLQTKAFGSAHFQLLDSVKLDEDNDKRVVFNMSVYDWMDLCLAKFGRCFQYVGAYTAGADSPVFGAPCNVENFNVMNASAQNALQAVTGTGGKFAWDCSTATQIVLGCLSGSLPFYVHCYPFGDQMDMEDWYNVEKVGTLRLQSKGGTVVPATATENVILQQLKKYG